MDLNIYTKNLTPDLISRIEKEFETKSMQVEFHPDFKFDEEDDEGFCPIKLKVKNGQSKYYDSFKYDVLTGFEIYFEDYNYQEEFKEKEKKNRSSFIKNLFKSAKKTNDSETYLVEKEIDKQLKTCDKKVTLNWQSQNKSELRISLLFGAILANLTEGIVYDPQEGSYFTGEKALLNFKNRVREYEDSIAQEDFLLHKFEQWN